MTAQDWTAIIGSASGLLSVAGHVAVLVIRELRRRPDTIPPIPTVVRTTTTQATATRPAQTDTTVQSQTIVPPVAVVTTKGTP